MFSVSGTSAGEANASAEVATATADTALVHNDSEETVVLGSFLQHVFCVQIEGVTFLALELLSVFEFFSLGVTHEGTGIAVLDELCLRIENFFA